MHTIIPETKASKRRETENRRNTMSKCYRMGVSIHHQDPARIDRLEASSLHVWLTDKIFHHPNELLRLVRKLNSSDPQYEDLRNAMREYSFDCDVITIESEEDDEGGGVSVSIFDRRNNGRTLFFDVTTQYPPTLEMLDLMLGLKVGLEDWVAEQNSELLPLAHIDYELRAA